MIIILAQLDTNFGIKSMLGRGSTAGETKHIIEDGDKLIEINGGMEKLFEGAESGDGKAGSGEEGSGESSGLGSGEGSGEINTEAPITSAPRVTTNVIATTNPIVTGRK